jgi:hypothetical protein
MDSLAPKQVQWWAHSPFDRATRLLDGLWPMLGQVVMPGTLESCNYGVASLLSGSSIGTPHTRRDWPTMSKWKGRLRATMLAYHQPPYESAPNGAFAAGQL